MSPADLPLRDIHLPPAPGWWPPAPGWWAVLALVLCAILAGLWWQRRRRRPRSAMAEARLLLQHMRANGDFYDSTRRAAELSELLRRVCVSLWPREQVAGLTGADWLAFLDRAQGSDSFSRGAGRLLTQAPYRRDTTRAELDQLLEVCSNWIAAVEQRGTERRA